MSIEMSRFINYTQGVGGGKVQQEEEPSVVSSKQHVMLKSLLVVVYCCFHAIRPLHYTIPYCGGLPTTDQYIVCALMAKTREQLMRGFGFYNSLPTIHTKQL